MRSTTPRPISEDSVHSLADEQALMWRPTAEMVSVLQALAHPVRLQIVTALCEGDTCVNVLASRLGVAQPIISQQLRILRMSNVVSVTREGGLALYRVARTAIAELVRSLERCCERHQ